MMATEEAVAAHADWQAEAVRRKHDGEDTDVIAEAVGKSPSTVRRALQKARESGEVFAGENGNGHVDSETAERLRSAAESGAIGGQQTIDGGEVPAEDDPEWTPEERAQFIGEAGEAVGPMPPLSPAREMDGGDTTHVEEIVMRGTTPLDFFNLGGKLPNKASLKFIGGKVGLESGTAFKKSDVIHFEGYATVVAATPRDKRDRQTGIVIECELQILAEIDDLHLTA